MAETAGGKGRRETDAGREDRLKAALKANMARRKAQARARAAEDGAEIAGTGQKIPDKDE